MIAAFAALLLGMIFLSFWLYDRHRQYLYAARTAKDMYRHASAARNASKTIQQVLATENVDPDFQPVLDLLLRHDKDSVAFCDENFRRWRSRIPKRLWAHYDLPED